MKYNRQFARRQWRSQFENKQVWRNMRQKGRAASFRNFLSGNFAAE